MSTETFPVHHKRTTCRACGASRLRLCLSLGVSALANSFVRSEADFADECVFPLDVYVCEECSLMQLLDVISPEVMFTRYIYVSRTAETIAAHNREYAGSLVDLLRLRATDLVVEIGSNDGSLLQCYQRHGVRILGIEPAANVAEEANANGIQTLNCFFGSETARRVRAAYGPARLITANNVLAHVDDTQAFLGGCHALLTDDGVLAVEVPYVRDLVERVEYDTIYHEHLCYFSVTTLKRLCESAQLSLVRIEHLAVHGGSLRMYAGRRAYYGDHAPAVSAWVEEERRIGLTGINYYEQFAAAVERHRRSLRDLLERLRTSGRTVAGYGAPAKSLLGHCGIDTRLLPYTVDKNPLKIGLYTPGQHIPVLPVETLLERQPDYVLILAWNFADEIVRQQAEYQRRGGRFIIPIPEPRVV